MIHHPRRDLNTWAMLASAAMVGIMIPLAFSAAAYFMGVSV